MPEKPDAPQLLAIFIERLDAVALDMRAVKDVLMVSTPERGCVVDSIRKHDAQLKDHDVAIAALRSSSTLRTVTDEAVRTLTKAVVLLLIAAAAKGLIVEIVAESIKLAGGIH